MSEGRLPRLSVDITPAQKEALNELIPHGAVGSLFGIIVDDLIYTVSKLNAQERAYFFGAAMVRKLDMKDTLAILREGNHGNDR